MDDGSDIRRLVPNLLLVSLLLAAQVGLTMHALGHDSGVPQGTICKTCVAADQLSAASLDSAAATEIDIAGSPLAAAVTQDFLSLHALPARQRGPPASARIDL